MLPPRQREVATRVAQGYSTKAIANELGISRRTVEYHIEEAAQILPGEGRPRYKIMLWWFSLDSDDVAA